jgi:hypothetical protein
MTASVKMAGCLLYGERNVIKKIFHLILVILFGIFQENSWNNLGSGLQFGMPTLRLRTLT